MLNMVNKTVYLAGPISGCSYDGAVNWREHCITELAIRGIKGISPMRAKSYLKEHEEIAGHIEFENQQHIGNALSSSRGIMTRDRFDATNCSVLLVNFLGAEKVSIGTAIEVGLADANRIPIVTVIEDSGNPHDHAMINEATGFRVNSLDKALIIIKSILSDY